MISLHRFFLLIILAIPAGAISQPTLNVYVFGSVDCPHCEDQKPFLQALAVEHDAVEVKLFEVRRTDQHHRTFRSLGHAHGIDAGSVPTVFVGGRAWIGDSPLVRREIKAWIEHCLVTGLCPDSAELDAPLPASSDAPGAASIDIPLIGTLDLSVQPLFLSTVLIAFVDGFNPCSIWVLTILIALVIHSGSRLRVLIVGVSFLSMTALIYGLFITGVFGVMGYVGYLAWVYWLVAGFALLFALVNIKDYFWYKRGLSFTIDDRHKPGMFRTMRGLISERRSIWGLILATSLMAAGIALIELPCTAGFPIVWSSLLATQDVEWPYFALLLGVYLLVYLVDELTIFFIAWFTLNISRFQERHGRLLKLLGGMVMLALAVVLLARPTLMQDVAGTIALFTAALGATMVVVLLHRGILPAMGVRLGDDWN